MYAYVKGKVELVDEHAVVVEANGVGYELICPNPFAFQDKIGEQVCIFTYFHVREDNQLLYGFKKTEEKQLFAKLLGVSGIGPKGALAVLASVQLEEFVSAVEREDDGFLTRFPGIGKKTARQMILDLKGKLSFVVEVNADAKGTDEAPAAMQNGTSAMDEAIEAMRSLGYSEREIKAIVPKLKKLSDATADDYVRQGLALMMQR